jgi:hypothetical protein
MSDYISRDEAIEKIRYEGIYGSGYSDKEREDDVVDMIESIPAADVVEVHAVIDRMNKERKRAKGNWHTDPYWLGWVDAMRRAERIVDGTIDDEPMYAPSTGEKKEDKQG